MTGIDRVHLVNTIFASKVIAGLGLMVGYEVNIFYPKILTESEESAYQQDANQDAFDSEPEIAGIFPVTGLNIKRFQSDRTIDLYPEDQGSLLYLPTELDVPNGVRIIITRGSRILSFSGDVIDVVEGVDEPIFKTIRLEPMEVLA